jgi:DmsE family decaheme c-type cytochrome
MAIVNIDLHWHKIIYMALIAVFFNLFSGISLAEKINCTTCHTKLEQTHQSTPHGKANVSCDSCHGDSEMHVVDPSSINTPNFYKQPARDQSKTCIGCHNASHGTRTPNPHSNEDMTCASCHSIHSQEQRLNKLAQLPFEYNKLEQGTSLCFDCHKDSFTQFELNEGHSLTQGVVNCSSCHDPHNPQIGMKLGGFKQSVCNDCHADVSGPFMFEHAASRVEGCAACHEPHGSPNRHMLKIQEVGALCYSCHADAPQFHVGFSPSAPPRFNESTVCTNCHVMIHGSNLDRNLLR